MGTRSRYLVAAFWAGLILVSCTAGCTSLTTDSRQASAIVKTGQLTVGYSPDKTLRNEISYNERIKKAETILNVSDYACSLCQKGSISPQDYTKYSLIIFEYSQLLKKYAGLPERNNEYIDLSYVSDTLQQSYDQNILTPQRLHNIVNMMEINYHYFLNNASPKSVQEMDFPGDNLMWLYYPGKGIQFQPVSTLFELQSKYKGGEYQQFLDGINEFIQYGDRIILENRICLVWEYNFYVYDNASYVKLGINSPHFWISGMAQGLAIQTLGYAYNITGDTCYLRNAECAMQPLFVNWTKGGVTDFHPSHNGTWYLEYAYTNKIRVLNGFLYTLIALHDYYKITNNADALCLFKMGVNDLVVHLKQYDTGDWSAYSLTSGSANLFYHKIHIDLLRTLYGTTSNSTIKYYADLFQKYLESEQR